MLCAVLLFYLFVLFIVWFRLAACAFVISLIDSRARLPFCYCFWIFSLTHICMPWSLAFHLLYLFMRTWVLYVRLLKMCILNMYISPSSRPYVFTYTHHVRVLFVLAIVIGYLQWNNPYLLFHTVYWSMCKNLLKKFASMLSFSRRRKTFHTIKITRKLSRIEHTFANLLQIIYAIWRQFECSNTLASNSPFTHSLAHHFVHSHLLIPPLLSSPIKLLNRLCAVWFFSLFFLATM